MKTPSTTPTTPCHIWIIWATFAGSKIAYQQDKGYCANGGTCYAKSLPEQTLVLPTYHPTAAFSGVCHVQILNRKFKVASRKPRRPVDAKGLGIAIPLGRNLFYRRH